MSGGEDGDVLMYFVLEKGGEPIAAESTSALADADKMTQDFKPGKYFEVDSFSFGVDLADDEGGSLDEGGDSRSYARWRALKDDTPKPEPAFQPEPQEMSFERRIDSASPALLLHCLNSRSFDKAILVKRARGRSKEGKMEGILRMEFSEVRLNAVEWRDGDIVMEVCKFRFAAVKVGYRKRKPDGSTEAMWACVWDSRNG